MPCIGAGEPPSPLERERTTGDFWIFLKGWIHRAASSLERGQSFEGLIYLWVSFNAWAGQVVADRRLADRDRSLVRAVAWDGPLGERFERLVAQEGALSEQCRRFHSLWPVFQARALLDRGLRPWRGTETDSRSAFRAECFRAQLHTGDWSPSCFQMHQPAGTDPEGFSARHVPLDWVHTLDAIYQVRCNLFHGGKTFRSTGDEEFVELSATILWNVWGLGGGLPADLLPVERNDEQRRTL